MNAADRQGRGPGPDSSLSIPEIRDYDRINAEVIQRLDGGQTHILLVGAEAQRLLLAGLTGAWSALIEIEGRAGPELGAGLNAPGLTLVARGPSADGAALGLREGRVILLGDSGDALAYGQEGGTVIAASGAGHRAGLCQRGGTLILLGRVGRLAGERQAGGRLFVHEERLGPYAGHGRRGGTLVRLPADFRVEAGSVGDGDLDLGLDPHEAGSLRDLLRDAARWIDPPRSSTGVV